MDEKAGMDYGYDGYNFDNLSNDMYFGQWSNEGVHENGQRHHNFVNGRYIHP
jgi:hypothetical protein